MAGNQLGKTWAGAFEWAIHLTGRYPDWWPGLRFDRPIRIIAGSESSELTRKSVQRLLVGTPEEEKLWGSGAIPKDCLLDWSRKQGVPNTLDNIIVKSEFGGNSVCSFASYDQGRTKWQADTLDGFWGDEEPPEDIYFEGLTRTNTTLGPVMVTFTPLKGMSKVVKRFYVDKFPGTSYTKMGIADAEHYTPEQREKIINTYPEHEREARANGEPKMGSGIVFPVPVDFIKIDAFPIPEHWPQLCGIDFGWDHPTAGVRMAWDRDNDCIYVTACHRVRQHTPVMFAPAVKAWGAWLKWAWPHDGLQHDKGSGMQLMAQYRDAGLNMLPEKATFDDGSNGVEAGITEMLDRMQTGRLKVFSHLSDWFEEFGLYHRKDGLIVKDNDDLISATRYGVMMKRFASTKPKPKPLIIQQGLHSWQS